ncbi:hypothetical protein ACLOJK_000144 [Asimina triloba]
MERYTVTASSSFTTSTTLFQTRPTTTTIRDRDASSFTSYLRPADPTSTAAGGGNRAEDNEISIFDAEKYFSENSDRKQAKATPPLDQIAGKRDFSTFPPLSSSASFVDGYGRNYRTGSFHATPTASSEASWNSQSGLLSNPPGSVPISMKNLPLNGQRRGSTGASSGKWFFGRRCPCSGKKSVDVEEKFREPRHSIQANPSPPNASLVLKKQSFKTEEAVSVSVSNEADKGNEKVYEIEEMTKLKLVAVSWPNDQLMKRDSSNFLPEKVIAPEIGCRVAPSSGRPFGDMGGFTFPILNPPPAGKLLGVGQSTPQDQEPPRLSLEVFRPSTDAGLQRPIEFQRRGTTPFAGDNCRRSFTFPASPKGREDDVASDSSSDLFEIESFSTQAASSYPMYRRRDSLDDPSSFEGDRRYGPSGHGVVPFRRSLDETTSVTPTECYEPSEVSVDWSVTTAEGFDRSSVANFSAAAASEYEEMRDVQQQRFGKEAAAAAAAAALAAGKRKGNGLLSCRCEKAVSVGPHPVKCGPEQHRVGPPSFPMESSARITAMSRLAQVSTASVARAAVADKSPIARSHSARHAACPIATR